MKFNTDMTIRNCAKCHTQPSLRHRKGKLTVCCDTCHTTTTGWWCPDSTIDDWNALMYQESGAAENEWTPEP